MTWIQSKTIFMHSLQLDLFQSLVGFVPLSPCVHCPSTRQLQLSSIFQCWRCSPSSQHRFNSNAMSPVVNSNVDNVRVVSTPQALPLSALSCLQLIKTSWFILGRRQIRGSGPEHPPPPARHSPTPRHLRRRWSWWDYPASKLKLRLNHGLQEVMWGISLKC